MGLFLEEHSGRTKMRIAGNHARGRTVAPLEGRCARVEPPPLELEEECSHTSTSSPQTTRLTWVHPAEGESRAVEPRQRAAQGQSTTTTGGGGKALDVGWYLPVWMRLLNTNAEGSLK